MMQTTWFDLLPSDGLILCAVSGGADSMYLLCRLHAEGYPVAAAHFNHRLRGAESNRDEAFVLSFCRERNILCVTDTADTRTYAAENRLGIEDAARQLRYAFLRRAAESLGARCIATAHSAEDQLETMLLNLARGSGLRGLCGIPPTNGPVIRPMLSVTRSEISGWLNTNGIPFVEDSSNADDCFARNRLRHHALPALQSVNSACASHAAQTAALLREDEQFLQAAADAFLAQHLCERGISCSALSAQPFSIASRAVRTLSGNALSLLHVQRILSFCATGQTGTLHLPGTQAVTERGFLRFGAAESTPLSPHPVFPGVSFPIEPAGLQLSCRMLSPGEEIHECLNIFFFQSDAICGKVTCKSRSPGDKILLAGRTCTHSLKKLFQQAGIPPSERDQIPVLYDEEGPIAVFGFGSAARTAPTGMGNVWCVCFSPL